MKSKTRIWILVSLLFLTSLDIASATTTTVTTTTTTTTIVLTGLDDYRKELRQLSSSLDTNQYQYNMTASYNVYYPNGTLWFHAWFYPFVDVLDCIIGWGGGGKVTTITEDNTPGVYHIVATVTDHISESTTVDHHYFAIENDTSLPPSEPSGTQPIAEVITYSYYDSSGCVEENNFEIGDDLIIILWVGNFHHPIVRPDLTITQGDITFSPSSPAEGDLVTINAIIHNIGDADAENVKIEFLLDGNSRENKTISVSADSMKTVTFDWIATAGMHIVTIRADPDNLIPEENESNNQASKEIEIEVYTHRVAYIPVRYTDGRSPTHTISELTQEAEYVKDYYEQQSYGTVRFRNVFVFNEWTSLGKNFSDYGSPAPEDYSKWKKIIDDAIAISEIDPQDYDAVVVIQPENVRAFADGKRTIQSESRDASSVWAHELGHAMFGFRDYYEPYSYISPWWGGNIHYWGLMGKGNKMNPPAPIMSFNKISAGWLYMNIIPPIGYGEYPIDLLSKLKYKDKVTCYFTLQPIKYYIFEGRCPPDGIRSDPHSHYSFHLKEEEGVLLYLVTGTFSNVYIVPYNGSDSSRVTLHPEESYKDALAAVEFTADKRDSQLYVDISSYLPYSKKIISICNITWEIPAIKVPLEPIPYENYFDIDLHVYSYDGQHIGMNYTSMEYEIQIPDAETSGNILGGGPEWISVPEDTKIYYIIDITLAREWSEELNVTIENITASWQVVCYDDNGTRRESEPITVNVSLEEVTILAILSTVDIDPDVLNLRSKGKWITAYIELPEGYGVEKISDEEEEIEVEVEGELTEQQQELINSLVEIIGNTIAEVKIKLEYEEDGELESEIRGYLNEDGQGILNILIEDIKKDGNELEIEIEKEVDWENYRSTIDINTVMLNFTIPAVNNTKYGFVKDPELKDRDESGLPELIVKFDMSEVQDTLMETSGMVDLTVTGEVMKEGIPILFKGMDSIRISKGKKIE